MKKALAFTLFFGIVFSMPAWALTGPEWLNKGLSSTDPDYKIECYTNAIDAGGLHKRTEFTIYALRGDAYTQKGQRDLAVKDYNKAIELNPDNQDMYKRRDALLPEDAPGAIPAIKAMPGASKAKAFPMAASAGTMTQFIRAVKQNPKDPAVYNSRGLAYLKTGQYDRAIQDFTYALELDQTYSTAFSHRETAMAMQDIVIQPLQDGALLPMESLSIKEGNAMIPTRPDYGMTSHGAPDGSNPTNALDYNRRGERYLDRGSLSEAMLDFNAAIALDPYFAQPYYNRALVCYRQKDIHQTIVDLNKAVQLNPGFNKAQQTLEKILVEKK